MKKLVLRDLFEINARHLLLEETPPKRENTSGLPYRAQYFKEINGSGKLICRYRYWELDDGMVYGAERMDLEGNVESRAARSAPLSVITRASVA